ncbi:MAG: hypothetical protein V4543_02800 [Bacteroidota bacterium]
MASTKSMPDKAFYKLWLSRLIWIVSIQIAVGTALLYFGLVPYGSDNDLTTAVFYACSAATATVFTSEALVSEPAFRIYTSVMAQTGTFLFMMCTLVLFGPFVRAYNISRIKQGEPSGAFNWETPKGLFGRLALYQLLFALTASLSFYFLFPVSPYKGNLDRLYLALFHGFSLGAGAGYMAVPNGFMAKLAGHAFIIQSVVSILTCFSVLGMPVMLDLVSPQSLRERLKTPDINWQAFTRLSILVFGLIIGFAAFVIYKAERSAVFTNLNGGEAGIASLFSTVSCLANGYQNFRPAVLGTGTSIFFLVLIIIGGSFFSAAASPFGLLLSMVLFVRFLGIRNKKFQNSNKFPDWEKLYIPIMTIACFMVLFNLSAWLLLLNSGFGSAEALAFNQLSYFSNSGLLWEPQNSPAGLQQIIYSVSMTVGRFGVLVLLFVTFIRSSKQP